MNRIRTSLWPLEPGRSSLRLCSRDPVIRSTSGRPKARPSSSSLSIAYETRRRVRGSPVRSAWSQSLTFWADSSLSAGQPAADRTGCGASSAAGG
jgi:hypothetical protein